MGDEGVEGMDDDFAVAGGAVGLLILRIVVVAEIGAGFVENEKQISPLRSSR